MGISHVKLCQDMGSEITAGGRMATSLHPHLCLQNLLGFHHRPVSVEQSCCYCLFSPTYFLLREIKWTSSALSLRDCLCSGVSRSAHLSRHSTRQSLGSFPRTQSPQATSGVLENWHLSASITADATWSVAGVLIWNCLALCLLSES